MNGVGAPNQKPARLWTEDNKGQTGPSLDYIPSQNRGTNSDDLLLLLGGAEHGISRARHFCGGFAGALLTIVLGADTC